MLSRPKDRGPDGTETDDAPVVLELIGIRKTYPGVLANDDVDLTIRRGEIHALLGENGAGKSTLIKIIYGLIKPDAGSLVWQGHQTAIADPRAARRLGIGAVMQHFSLVPALSVLENLLLAMDVRIKPAALRENILDLAQYYGLQADPDSRVADLSMGERQRVEIMKALLGGPKLLIMDEPTSVLAPQEVETLFAVLRRLAAEGTSILYISHKLDEVIALCENVTVLRAGRVVAQSHTRDETARSLAEKMLGANPDALSMPEASKLGAERLVVDRLSTAPGQGHGMPLSEISLCACAGEILGIAGIAGNGQSALFAALIGEMVQPTPSAIRIDGKDVAHLQSSERRMLALRAVPEERNGHAAIARLPLTANFLLTNWRSPAFVRRGLLREGKISQATRDLMKAFDVRAVSGDAVAGSLSGGNLQKFVVGRETLQEPGILVVNQPTWGVDAGAAVVIRQALIDLASRGAAIVVISQDLDELLALSTSLAVLSKGRLSQPRPTGTYSMAEIGRLMGAQAPALVDGRL